MENEISRSDEALRQVFKIFNRFILLVFRLGLGKYGNQPETSQVMVLVHTGRKSGLQRRTPINYAIVDNEVYCTAAFGHRADWYRNIMANPEVELWLNDSWWAGVAEEVPQDDPRHNEIMREVLIASGFAAPFFAGLNPKSASDEELAEVSAGYRLIRLRRSVARTGPGGPGDLAWVWPATTFAFLAMCFIGMRCCKARRCKSVATSTRASDAEPPISLI
ncbi:MAG: nitroreductase family deazaflavin-dependent oxidoreductase [Chloroflexi bacterium]|nr:nitroreductase family deazaflavin-dependent oxidoreductase [Chloroflexota bacterium]